MKEMQFAAAADSSSSRQKAVQASCQLTATGMRPATTAAAGSPARGKQHRLVSDAGAGPKDQRAEGKTSRHNYNWASCRHRPLQRMEHALCKHVIHQAGQQLDTQWVLDAGDCKGSSACISWGLEYSRRQHRLMSSGGHHLRDMLRLCDMAADSRHHVALTRDCI